MTSIASSSNYTSPRQLLQNELLSEVSSGTVSSTDQTALASALDDIDQSLSADSSGQSSSSKPGDMKSKIDDLISNEVSSGKLTSDQASELQNLFKNAFAKGAGHAHHGGHHHGGLPPSGDSQSSDATDASSSSDNASQLLQDLIKSAQDTQSSSYSADGTKDSTASSSASASLLDYTA